MSIKVYMSKIDHIEADSLKRLNPDEITQFNKFRQPLDRQRSLHSLLLAKKMITDFTNLSEEEVEIIREKNGRPYFLHSNWQGDFNLSHSGAWVVGAITNHGRIGVDIEEHKPRQLNLFRKYFSIKQMNELKGIEDQREQLKLFYHWWTLKESVVKATGHGLALGLRNINFSWNEMEQCYQCPGTSWRVKHFPVCEDYVLALCTDQQVFPSELEMLS